ncbi:MAG TPA: alpha/beta hydrolase-fold protein [Kofleriaceae bacterium]|nr:alpha/beta hydrolase-fold protein [Kofleriaceae bacterium]
MGCGGTRSSSPPDGAPGAPDGSVSSVDASLTPDAGGSCAPGSPGVACLIDLHDRLRANCDASLLASFESQISDRRARGEFPLWSEGRALFVADKQVAIAGGWNDWNADLLKTSQLCGGALYTAVDHVAKGRWPYKLVDGADWIMDPASWSFEYDDYAGNVDGKNSVLDTPDSGLGHLVRLPDLLCSNDLGNCRPLTTYLPAGYDDPANYAKKYPVLFMHDGQNVYDDHDCCFGHTGWEVNVQLDADIAAGNVAPIVVVAADHGGAARNSEYGTDEAIGGELETFMKFQVETIQPRAAEAWRIDLQQAYVAGSSLGGLLSVRLALAYPDTYRGAASLSGAFWFGMDSHTAVTDFLAKKGRVPVAIYLDHGGDPQQGTDDATDSVAIRDQMIALGWQREDSASCTLAANHVCYYWEPGATHDELAWKARSWRFLRYFFPAH